MSNRHPLLDELGLPQPDAPGLTDAEFVQTYEWLSSALERSQDGLAIRVPWEETTVSEGLEDEPGLAPCTQLHRATLVRPNDAPVPALPLPARPVTAGILRVGDAGGGASGSLSRAR